MEYDFTSISGFVWALLVVVFFFGGVFKGLAGAGLPIVLVTAGASILPPALAVAVATFPMFATNVLQAWQGRRYWQEIKTFWRLLFAAAALTFVGAKILVAANPKIIALVLGCIVVTFALTRIFKIRMTVPDEYRYIFDWLFGCLSGFIGGMSGFHGPPIMIYFATLKLPKDFFVALLATVFVIGGLPLYGSLMFHNVLTFDVLMISMAASVPVLIGMEIGRRLRGRFSETGFAKILTVFFFIMGANLIRRGLF